MTDDIATLEWALSHKEVVRQANPDLLLWLEMLEARIKAKIGNMEVMPMKIQE